MNENGILGIVAEYNPFHNGHSYHIEKAKEISGAKYTICIISGNFVQRGNCSVVNKWKKAEMALLNGADLVIELPTVYSVSSAEGFAHGAMKIFKSLNVVDAISFGTETSDYGAINNIASVVCEEPKQYKEYLSNELGKGVSFPKAREEAIKLYFDNNDRYSNILNCPNNILAVEYLKSLKKLKSTIQPVPIQREKVYYNDNKIIDDFASATAIRRMLQDGDFSGIRKVVPNSTYEILSRENEIGNLVLDLSNFEKQIIYNLRRMSIEEIRALPDVNEGLEHNLKNAANYTNNLEDFIDIVKSKRYTQSRIQRILICALLGITKKDVESFRKVTPYVRILGFNESGRSLISKIKNENPRLPVITSVKKFKDTNTNKIYSRMLDIDIFATDVYTMACKNDSIASLDFTKNMVMI